MNTALILIVFAAQRANPIPAHGKRRTSAALGMHPQHDGALKGRDKAGCGFDRTKDTSDGMNIIPMSLAEQWHAGLTPLS